METYTQVSQYITTQLQSIHNTITEEDIDDSILDVDQIYKSLKKRKVGFNHTVHKSIKQNRVIKSTMLFQNNIKPDIKQWESRANIILPSYRIIMPSEVAFKYSYLDQETSEDDTSDEAYSKRHKIYEVFEIQNI